MLTIEEQDNLVSELAERPGHEKVRVLLYRLLVETLGADSREIDFEKPAPEVRGRIDALLGRTVFELKSDLRRERNDAEHALGRYLSEREDQTGEKYVGVATDGAQFVAFFLKSATLIEVGAYDTDPRDARELIIWLQGVVAVGDELLPNPQRIKSEFGRESLAAQRALADLKGLWSRIGNSPEAKLKRELWITLLGLAYGADVGNDALFLQHTYLAIVAKAIAWGAIIGVPPQEATALLHGEAFQELGISGQNEPDFFDWVLDDGNGRDLVTRIACQVSRFNLHDIRTDILKVLYESLIDPETRHDLGEYYTPDWLAARLVSTTIVDPLKQRVIDPACGSGTFLFHAIRAILDAAQVSGLSSADAVRLATNNVAGIDIHPVAVIFARVTCLLALLPALRDEHPGDIAVPVYLGDALQWNMAPTGEQTNQLNLLASGENLEIFVPEIEVSEPKPKRLNETTLRFPAAIARDAVLFDRLLREMIDYGARSEPTANFSAWMERHTPTNQDDHSILLDTYNAMCDLQSEGRNHIWGYVARNLARPVWLSSEAQKADVVIGNPPWLSYRFMSKDFQSRFRKECKAAELWVGGNVATQQDLSSYFYFRVVLLYMRRTGRVALVMPYASMSRKAYAKFLQAEVFLARQLMFRLRFQEAWTFGPEVQPLFPVPSCVLFAERYDSSLAAPLPPRVLAYSGTLPERDADTAQAETNLEEAYGRWPDETSKIKEQMSPYEGAFRNGATLFPRRLVLVTAVPGTSVLPPNPEFPLVSGRVGSQDKKPWKTIPPPRGTVEKLFLRPILLGQSIAPYRVLEVFQAIIPWDEERSRLLDAHSAARRGYPRLAKWLENTELIWNEHKQGEQTFLEQCDYYRKLSGQFPISPIRVVYTKSGTNLVAAMVQDESAIVDHVLYWAQAQSTDEALYLCGVLNSEALRTAVEKFQSQGQWGKRHFDKYVFNVPFPRFDIDNTLHYALSESARLAERLASGVEIAQGEHFVRVRKRVRAALDHDPVANRLEELVTDLLHGAHSL